MHTLSQLNAGELSGITRLSLSENLSEFPLAILTLADSLEILDLSNNKLSSLPDELTQLHKLKVIFASHNCFEKLHYLFDPAGLRQDHFYINRKVDDQGKVCGVDVSGSKVSECEPKISRRDFTRYQFIAKNTISFKLYSNSHYQGTGVYFLDV